MIDSASSQQVESLSGDLEAARALFAVGDYNDVLSLIEPIISDEEASVSDRCDALRLRACVESERGQWVGCLGTLKDAAPLIDLMPADKRAKFYGQRALAHRNVGEVDAALVDYEEARYWAKKAGDQQTEASVRNNLAKIYSDVGRGEEAIVEVDAAIKIATERQDEINLGRYYDMKAQVLIIRSEYEAAIENGKRAVGLLGHLSDTHTALIEARSTYSRALIGLAALYLEHPDPVAGYCARRDAAKLIST